MTKEDKEFDLSEKEVKIINPNGEKGISWFFPAGDVKEFIRLLKKGCVICGRHLLIGKGKPNKSRLCQSCITQMSKKRNWGYLRKNLYDKIDTLAGDKLVEKQK